MEHTCLTSCGLFDLFSYRGCDRVMSRWITQMARTEGFCREVLLGKIFASLTLAQREGSHEAVETGGSTSPDQLT